MKLWIRSLLFLSLLSLSEVGWTQFSIDLPGGPSSGEEEPILPPRPNPSPGTSPTTPGTRPPVRPPTRPVMNPVETAWPQESCRTLEYGELNQLIRAAENLRKAIPPHPSCDLGPQRPTSQAIQQSSNQLGQNVTNILATISKYLPDSNLSEDELRQFLQRLSESPADFRQFITQVNAANSEILGLANNLRSAGFLNSECGQSYTRAGFILNLTELTSQIIPLFSTAARFIPELQLATPVLLGLSALGSGSALIRQAHTQNTLDMTQPATRRALLTNVCEFTKVARRLKAIQAIESGRFDEVGELYQTLQSEQISILTERFSPATLQRSQSLSADLSRLSEFTRQSLWGLQETQSTRDRLLDGANGFNFCRTFVARWKNQGAPVFQRAQALANQIQTELTNANSRGEFSSLLQIWQADQAAAQARILVLPLDRSPETQSFCQNDLRDFLALTEEVFKSSEALFSGKAHLAQQELSSDIELQQIASIRRSFDQERNALAQIEQVFRSLVQNGHSIARSEIEIEFNYSRLGLFGARDSSICALGHCVGYGGFSPAMAWLDFYWGHYQRNRDNFNDSFENLVEHAYRFTRSGKNDFSLRDEKGEVIRDERGRPRPMSPAQQQTQLAQDWMSAMELKPLDLSQIPARSAYHEQICRTVDNAWSRWVSMTDQLAAQTLFCQEITAWVQTGLDKRLTQHCMDEYNTRNQLVRSSTVRSTRESLARNGTFASAQNILEVQKRLQCAPN